MSNEGEGELVEVIQREYQNIPECHVWDDSEFSQPNVGRHANVYVFKKTVFCMMSFYQLNDFGNLF